MCQRKINSIRPDLVKYKHKPLNFVIWRSDVAEKYESVTNILEKERESEKKAQGSTILAYY